MDIRADIDRRVTHLNFGDLYIGDLFGIALAADLLAESKPRGSTGDVPARRKPGFWHSAEPQAIIAVMAATGVALLAAPVLFLGWVVIGL